MKNTTAIKEKTINDNILSDNEILLLDNTDSFEASLETFSNDASVLAEIQNCNKEIEDISKSNTSSTYFKNDSISMYMNTIKNYSVLTAEDTKDLFKKLEVAKSEDEKKFIKEKILVGNIRLAVHFAKICMPSETKSCEYTDLIQEGSIGLMKAIERYDYKLGYNFSTYATWWIRQSVTRALMDKDATVRMPVHIIEKQRKINSYVAKRIADSMEYPTVEEIAAGTNLAIQDVEFVKKNAISTISYDKQIVSDKCDESSTLVDYMEADNNTALEALNDCASEELLRAIKKVCTPKEYDVLLYRFGFKTGDIMTLADVGAIYNVSRERIRQIESKALKKIRINFMHRGKTMANYM